MTNCKTCGCKIKSGSYCDDCKLATVRELRAKFGPEKKTLLDLKKHPTLYHANSREEA